jgi:hypothetical protein
MTYQEILGPDNVPLNKQQQKLERYLAKRILLSPSVLSLLCESKYKTGKQ